MLTKIELTVREREASQEQMRRFFADASHELRTPLASLLANAELHQHGALTEPAQVTEVMRRVSLETSAWGAWSTTCSASRGSDRKGDEELLRRAADNLFANVLVHTPHDTAGTIAATASDGQIRIEVSDDGPGIATDKLPRIFERFYRAGTGASRPGAGLGLAIVAEVAAAHGGTAEAAPASPHGLRITLTLPVDQQTPTLPPTETVLADTTSA